MATQPQQGIMALPKTGSEQAEPQLSLDDSYDAIRGGLGEADPASSAQVQQQLNTMLPALDQLSDEQLDGLIQIVQYLHDHEKDYKEIVAQLVKDGVVDEGVFPEEYNPEVIATLGMVFLEARRQRRGSAGQQMPQPPMQLAKGGIADAARLVASHGRYGDTMLAHINKKEAAFLKANGGSGTINPKTGLPEYWGGFIGNAISSAVGSVTGAVKSVVNGVVDTVKSVVASPVGKVLATAALAAFIGPAAFGLSGALGAGASLGLASMGVSVLGGGNLKDALQAGAKGFFLGSVGAAAGAPLGGATGVTSAAGQAALGAGAAGTGLGLLTGKGLQGAVKEGLTAATMAGLATGGSNMMAGKDFMTPAEAGQVKVDPKTGQVATGGQPVGPGPEGKWTDASGNQIRPDAGKFDQLMTDVSGPGPVGSTPAQPAAAADKGMWDTIKDTVSGKSAPTTQEVLQSDTFKNLREQGLSADKALDIATKQLTPSLLAQYGAPVAAGLGATALMGGFKPAEAPQMSPQMASAMSGQATRDLMAANPKDYLVQNLPGVQYDAKGNIIGSTPWTPRKAAQTEVASDSYIPFTPPTTYQTPKNSVGSSSVYQPYNTADMYTNLQQPRYAADGGYMQSQPTFPGTPLTTDTGPLMGQEAHPLSMNTPGVAMNTPMGFADGGIASISPQHFFGGGLAAIVRSAIEKLNLQDSVDSAKQAASNINPDTFKASTYAGAAPSGGGTAPAASAVSGALQNAGYAPIATTAAPVDVDTARARAAQQLANQRLMDYHARQIAQNNMNIDPSQDMGAQIAQRLNPSLYDQKFRAQLMSGGLNAPAQQGAGIASLAVGGYPRRTGQISGPGTETSDDIPAMLSDGEFVMTAKAVKGLGGGNRRAGAKKMYALMHRLEKNAARG